MYPFSLLSHWTHSVPLPLPLLSLFSSSLSLSLSLAFSLVHALSRLFALHSMGFPLQ